MANGRTGIDTDRHVSTPLLTAATTTLGGAPAFWGRYFHAPGGLQSGHTVTLHAALYMSQGDTASAYALTRAITGGAICAGVWIARYHTSTCVAPADWDDALVTPRGGLPCPILAWQYSDSCDGFDTNQANPAHQDMLLSRLALPPGPSLMA